ncbi:unnamed protein product [Calypogeia fissa]
MVVGVWELVKFLWSHPIISCLVLLLFSPPFFPIIVYFSPVLLCTGLVAIAMVSMSMGGGAQSEDWRDGTGRLYEPTVLHHVEVPAKPARESWLDWMKKKEEKAKAWVDSRFLNQDKWHLQNTSLVAPEEEPDLVVHNNESDVEYRIPSYKAHTPIKRVHVLSPMQANRDVLPPLAGAYSSVSAVENISSIPRTEVALEDGLFAFPNLEDQSLSTLEVPLAAIMKEEVVKGESVVPSPLKEDVLLSVVAKVKNTANKEIPSPAPTAESPLEEQPITECKSEPPVWDEGVVGVPLVSSNKEVSSLVGISERFRKVLKRRKNDRIAEGAAESIASQEQVVGNENVVHKEARNVLTGADLHGSRVEAVEVLVSPEFSFAAEDKKAGPEAEEEETQSTQKIIATEKIIFVDEPSKSTRVENRSMVVATVGQMEALPIQKASGQIIVVDTKLSEDSKSARDGLDENIESHRNLPLLTATAAVLVEGDPDSMALVKSQSLLEESSKALVQSILHHRSDLELLAEQMEPMMSFSGSMLEKSYSLNSTFRGERDEYDDLTARFNALKKSMSLHTPRRWQEPIPISLRSGNKAVVPVYVPDMGSRVGRDNLLLESSQAFPEKKESLTQPRLSSEDIESLEALTARLQKKFTLNLGSDLPIGPPPTRPVPALPSIAAAPTSVQSEKSAIAAATLESDDVTEVTGTPVSPTDSVARKSKLKNSQSKKALTSFLSRRRERLISSQLVDPFSISGEGEREGSKLASGTSADTVTPAEIVAEGRDEGSTTSGRHLKEKMISPLKRVFSIDANAENSSSRKVEVGGASSAKSSPVKEKQSVIDRSKGRLMKLFSNEGGLTKVQHANSDTTSLRRSKSVSQKTSDQNVELIEDHSEVVENVMSLPITPKSAASSIPSEVVHGVENVGVNSEMHEELPSIEAGAPIAESAEEVNSILEPTQSSPAKERVTPLDAGGQNNSAEGRGGRVTNKTSSGKKFAWSWRNSQKSISQKIGEQNVELGEGENEVDHPAMSMPTTPELAPYSFSTEVVPGHVGTASVQSEKQVSPGIATTGTLLETEEGLDNAVEPIPSSPTLSTPTLEAKEAGDCPKAGGSEVTKSSSEKKFGWTWKKKKHSSESLDDALPMMDQFRSQDDEASSLSQTEGFEVVQGVDKVDVESEYKELPSIAEAAAAPVIEISKELDGMLERIPASLTTSSGRVTKASSEKKFEWSWTKKKRSSEPLDNAPNKVDQFRSQDDEAIPLSREGMLEESRVFITSPLTRFHSSSAIMSPVCENSPMDVPVPWDENHSSEFRFSPRPDSNSAYRDSPKANSPLKKSSMSWWSPKPDHSKIDHPVEEKVVSAEKKSSMSWWSRKHRRADSEAVSSSSPADISSPTKLSSIGKNDCTDSTIALPCERSGPVCPLSTTTTVDNDVNDFRVGNRNGLQKDIILECDEELSVEVRPRPGHRRERSDSLPTASTGAKFSRLHTRQTSMSEITLPRTPELSPALSSGRATDYNNITGGMSSSSGIPFSMPRMEDGHYPEHVKISSHSNSARSINDKGVWRRTSSSASSYQISPSSVRMLDLANEQLKGGSPFHRSDWDVSSRGLYKSSPSTAAAEIRITDKLKAPLEEILSLLAIGDNGEQHRLTTVDSSSTGRAIAGGDSLRQASSSSSSEEETSSEEEWSGKSDNEDESQEQQQQFTLPPPSGRIRRRLPPYVFSREEPPAN